LENNKINENTNQECFYKTIAGQWEDRFSVGLLAIGGFKYILLTSLK